MSRSLALRFALISSVLSLTLMVGLAAILHSAGRRQLLDHYAAGMSSQARLVAQQAGELLATVTETMEALAGNSVLATALVDSAGKETYLIPFLSGFRRVDGLPVGIVFTDFEAKTIATNGRAPPSEAERRWLLAAIAEGRPRATLLVEGGRPHLLAAEMLAYSRTATPEGALFYRLPLDALIHHSHATLIAPGVAAPQGRDGEMVVSAPLPASGRLGSLGLSMALRVPSEPTGVFPWLLPLDMGAALLAAGLLVAGSLVAAGYVTRGLRELEGVALNVMRQGLGGQRARMRGADEVDSLARAFNYMLDQLGAAAEARERRSAAEIAAQRGLATLAEQARLEAEEARRLAERANQAKSRFLAAASHDLRQPFQAMRLFHDLLRARLAGRPEEPITIKLGEAMAAGESLLTALPDISTLEAGVVRVEKGRVSLAPLLARLMREFEGQAQAAGLTLRLAGAPDAMCRSDPVLLERMLRNLLLNAVRYTRSGGVLAAIRPRGGAWSVEVWDTGIGIPADKIADIFEDFYQVENDERDRALGLGLGLSVVQRMSRMLGHRVSVSSRVGRGSVFRLLVEADQPTSVQGHAPDFHLTGGGKSPY
ncbi:MAG: HAMP domain-containing protein [Alphaproteobacteria bacterium]|nr:HAMP domain-containing protein [Alphaproteobacteria bacterium]